MVGGSALLLVLCAAVRAAEEGWTGDLVLRFGVSLSKTGTLPYDAYTDDGGVRCFWCREAEQGLRWWATTANNMDLVTRGSKRIRIQLDIRDDGAVESQCYQNYEDLAPVTDFLFGPSWVFWNEGVRRITERIGKVLVLWAIHTKRYVPPPFLNDATQLLAWEAQAHAEVRLLAEARDNTSALPLASGLLGLREAAEHAASHSVCPGGVSGSSAGCSALRLAPPSTSGYEWLRSNEVLPPSEVGLDGPRVRDWFLDEGAPPELAERLGERLRGHEDPERRLLSGSAQASNFAFNSNIEEDETALATLDALVLSGARKFIFVYFPNLPGGRLAERQALHNMAYVRNRERGSVSAWGLACDHFHDFALCGHVLTYASPDVIFHCGSSSSLWSLLALLVGFKTSFGVLVADRPDMFGLEGARAYMKMHTIEVSPLAEIVGSQADGIFGSLDGFVNAYRDAFGYTPGFGATTIISAGTLLVEALQRARGTDANSIASYLKGLRAGEAFPHMLGPYYFDTFGRRTGVNAGIRQLLDLVASRTTRPKRHRFVRLLHVSVADLRACLSTGGGRFGSASLCTEHISDQLVYPSLDWISRAIHTALCVPGCVPSRELADCVPCPRGQYHNFQDMECRPCNKGEYADAPGLSRCKACPKGAVCEDPTQTPVAAETFFRMILNVSAPGATVCGDETGATANTVQFVRCHPQEVCVGTESPTGCIGSNTGMGCGQCSTGYTYQGIATGSRVCKKCPSFFIILGLFCLFVLAYVILTMFFSYLGYYAAFGPGYLPLLMARSGLHWIHVLGICYEKTRMDANGYTGYFLVPIDILYRPLDLFLADCWDEHTDSHRSISHMGYAYWYIMVAGFAVITGGHICYWIAGFLKNSFLTVVHAIRRRAEKSVKGKGADTEKEVKEPEEPEEVESDEGDDPEPPAEEAYRLSQSVAGPDPGTNCHGFGTLAAVASQAANPSAGQYFSEASTATVDSTQAPKKFSLLHGAGLNYTELHEHLIIEKQLKSSFIRCCLAWILLIYPVYLRGTSRMFACTGFDEALKEKRLVVNFDIFCDSDVHRQATKGTSIPGIRNYVFTYMIWAIVPVFLMLFLRCYGGDRLLTILFRRRSAILFDGFRSGMEWWEVVMFMRTGILIIVSDMDISQSAVRLMALLGILVFFFGAHFFVRPFEPRYREAMHHLELGALLGAMSILLMGLVNEMLAQSRELAPFGGGVVIVIAINTTVGLSGLLVLFVTSVSIDVEAIIEAGSTVSNFTRRVHRLVQIFPGVSPVYYYREGDRRLVDVSNLTWFEKQHLTRILNETVSVCIDCSDEFKSWVVEHAIHEAFRRAVLAREGKLRDLYCHWGTRTFTIWGVFAVSLRAPDIPPKGDECEVRAAGTESGDAVITSGVTVDELNSALLDVNHDIVEGDPSIFGIASRQYDSRAKQQQRHHLAHHGLHHTVEDRNMTWAQSESSDSSESDSTGSSSIVSGHGDVPEDVPEDDTPEVGTANNRSSEVVRSFTDTPSMNPWEYCSARKSIRLGRGNQRTRRSSARRRQWVEDKQEELLNEMHSSTLEFKNRATTGELTTGELQAELLELEKEYEELQKQLTARTEGRDSAQSVVN